MVKKDIQSAFFQMIKDPLPGHLSLVDEIADTLEVSNDSAYRRIRGETFLTFDEIAILSTKYGVSLDNLTSSSSDLVTFKFKPLDECFGIIFRHLPGLVIGKQFSVTSSRHRFEKKT